MKFKSFLFIFFLLIVSAAEPVVLDENDEYTTMEFLNDVQFVKDLINVVFKGLGFVDMLNGEEVCFKNIE